MTRPARQLPYQVVHYLAGTYSGASDSSGKVIGKIPAGSLVVGWHVRVAVACGGTATIDIGWANGATSTNIDRIAANTSIAENTATSTTVSGGSAAAVAVSTKTPDGDADREIILTTANIASTGRFDVAIAYIPANDVFPVA